MKLIRAHKFISACILLAVLAAAVVFYNAVSVSPEDIADREAAIQQTVRERALQCYVIEDAYPESLAYLEENYGLAVNKEDYLIVYDLFARNQPPQIKVIYRGDQP